jgi:hypothetical protein
MQTARSQRIALIGGIVALVAVVAGGAWWWSIRPSEARQVVFTVPPGTVNRMAAGEPVNILPGTIDIVLDQQDTLVIRNEDTQPIQIGPYKIQPGQQFSQRFYNPGTFDLLCSVHESERLRIVVRRTAGAT